MTLQAPSDITKAPVDEISNCTLHGECYMNYKFDTVLNTNVKTQLQVF